MLGDIVEKILLERGISASDRADFLNPNYDKISHDPFLLPEMDKAIKRLEKAHKNNEKIVIYGDYDVDGISATSILSDAFTSFGFDFETYTPDRISEGYGLNMKAIRALAASEASLAVTVDCGSLSHEEIEVAGKLGLDVIVTDHHALAETMPPAIATINPHRPDSKYPFADLCGAGVAFKLVQALQTKLDGLPVGQEKWLLDLVALGTICDIVPLIGENRMLAYWGLEVLKKTRRPGLKALTAVAKINPKTINSRTVGFVFGPRLNAAGRIAHARTALKLLMTKDNAEALELAQKLEDLNAARKAEQNKIFQAACEEIDANIKKQKNSPVLVIGQKDWNEGVIGIVASKLVERYSRPAFVMSVSEKQVKGSGRSFGDFHLAKAIDATRDLIEKGGGHAAAAGVTLLPENLQNWQTALNDFYKSLNLKNQEEYLLVKSDIILKDFAEINLALLEDLSKLEPFGMGNERPIFAFEDLTVKYSDRIGKQAEHLRLTVIDKNGRTFKLLAFSPPEAWFVSAGEKVKIWTDLEINEWQGRRNVEGRILRLELSEEI